MDLKEIISERRKLEIKLFQAVNEFEQKTEMEVKGMVIIRNDQGLQLVKVKIDIPE